MKLMLVDDEGNVRDSWDSTDEIDYGLFISFADLIGQGPTADQLHALPEPHDDDIATIVRV